MHDLKKKNGQNIITHQTFGPLTSADDLRPPGPTKKKCNSGLGHHHHEAHHTSEHHPKYQIHPGDKLTGKTEQIPQKKNHARDFKGARGLACQRLSQSLAFGMHESEWAWA